MTPNYVKLVQDTVLPRIALCRQTFAATRAGDPAAAVRDAMARAACTDKVKPGMSIAITAGSRGIADFPELLTAIVAARPTKAVWPRCCRLGWANNRGPKTATRVASTTSVSLSPRWRG